MMSTYELCNILLKWLQTFELNIPCSTLDDITDGVAMAQTLHQIAPEWFSNIWLSKIKTDVGENWRLKVSNMKKIIEGVADYYQEYVNSNIDFVKPDASKIGEHKDPSELVKLLQLILGCAVNCNRKQEYIQKIMQMEESVQNVIMQLIQELESLLGSTPSSFSSNLNAGSNPQIEHLLSELQMTSEAKDQLAQKCQKLDTQLTNLQEEKHIIIEEKRRLEECLRERLQEINTDPIKDNILRKQIDSLKEEVFKLETVRDDYRVKFELQEREMVELQKKFDSLQHSAAEARHLKDEVDILREDADKVEKLESTVQLYKKKLEELSECKRDMKLLEDKNLAYIQQTLELEEELKKANAWKTQAEMYRKQVAELRISLNEETKKLDKMEFENMKAQEKLNALLKEKERLIIERDSLKEANEDLLCNKLQLKEESSDLPVENKSSTISGGIVSVIELKRELVKLHHENTLLKINRQQSEDEKLPLLQTLYDDISQQNKQLQMDYRQANQRILQLEAELKEQNENKTATTSSVGRELQNQLQSEKTLRMAESVEKDRLVLELKHIKTILFEAIAHKDQEFEELEDKYRKCLEKARSVAKSLDFPELLSTGEEFNMLRSKISEKNDILEEVEKQFKQDKLIKDTEEKLLASAFYNFAQKKHQESMDQRLINTNSSSGNLPFLARQRQSATKRIPYNSK